MRIYYVANARMPTEKAHGIQIAKMCEAIQGAGHTLTLLVPSRASGESLQAFYGLRADISLIRLPSLVFHRYGRIGYMGMGVSFMCSALAFLFWKKIMGERFWIYTVDIDTFSHTLLPLVGPTVAEMHSPKQSTVLSRFFFARARIVVATNSLIKKELEGTFGISPLIEPNGVDMQTNVPSEAQAREKLALGTGKITLYVGRIYAWKGLHILGPVSRRLREEGIRTIFLGGSKEEFQRIFGDSGALEFAEAAPSAVLDWMAAADTLLLIGTTSNTDSNKFTAPMKVFEYLSTGKPIVASRTDALADLIPEDMVRFCPPDDSEALTTAVLEVLTSKENPAATRKRKELAKAHSWDARAQRILASLTHADTLSS